MDENCLQIEDLPDEMMVEIFSYLNKTEKMKISMVNNRWFGIINNEIKTLLIRWPEPNNFSCVVRRLLGWPQEKNQDFQNLIVRFPKLKNLELATKITNEDPVPPLDSYDFDGTMEFDINRDLIQTKNPEVTFIKRIKTKPGNVKDFEYKEDQIMNFEINMIRWYYWNWYTLMIHDMDDISELAYPKCDSVIEEVRSLDNVSKIEYYEDFRQENFFLVKLIRSILSRPYLKQIIFHVWYPRCNRDYLDIEEEFPKNWNVEEITFDTWAPSFKFLEKVLDALPNIKKVEILNWWDFENLPVFLKNISSLKHLKSLNVAICGSTNIRGNDEHFDALTFRQMRDCCKIIKNNFPMNSEVVIADLSCVWPNYLMNRQSIIKSNKQNRTNLIEKKEGENPKIVNGLSEF